MAHKKYRRQQMLADINITNLVDVTLVLLIIFIIVAPFLEQGLKIRLPEARGDEIIRNAVTVELDSEGLITVEREICSLETLEAKLVAVMGVELATRPVHFRGDQDVRYGDLTQVFSIIKGAGVRNLNLVTKPLDES